jgi:hypothetical protein
MLKAFLAVFAFMFACVAFGQDFPMPDVDPLPALLDLIKNWKATGWLGIGMTLIVILVQLLKTVAQGFKYSGLAVVFLSVVYAALIQYSQGVGVWSALISAFIVGGGAVAIYEAYKGIGKMLAKKE